MWLRLTKLATATLITVVLWALTLIPNSPDQVWVRPLSAGPRPVRILRFFATVGAITPGQSAQLCYGVENARMVRIAPLAGTASPSLGRCIEIHPEHTTHYTLQAEGFDGTVVIRSITVPVQDRLRVPYATQQVAWLR